MGKAKDKVSFMLSVTLSHHAIKAQGYGIKPHEFWTLELMEVSGQYHTMVTLPPGK
jgi:hypothetical protein